MAYVPKFSKTLGALEDEEQRRLQGSDAVAPNVMASSGQGGGVAAGSEPPDFARSNFVSGKKIMEKARDQPVSFEIGQEYKQKLGEAEQKLGASQSDWQKQYEEKVKPYQFNNEQVDMAVEGKDAANVGQFLQSDFSGGAPVALPQYKAPVLGFNPNDLSLLNTSVGLQGEIARSQRRAGNTGYSRGQAALDSVLYGGNPGVRGQVAALGQQAQQYGSKAKDVESGIGSQVEALPEIFNKEKEKLRGQLSERQRMITEQAKPMAKHRRMKALPDAGGYRGEAARMAKSYADKLYTPTYKGGLERDAAGLFDKYYSVDEPDVIYSGDEAAKFNRINELLGGGENIEANKKLGNRFNKTAYEQALEKLYKDYASKDAVSPVAESKGSPEAARHFEVEKKKEVEKKAAAQKKAAPKIIAENKKKEVEKRYPTPKKVTGNPKVDNALQKQREQQALAYPGRTMQDKLDYMDMLDSQKRRR